MKYLKKNRKFKVGLKKDITIYDKGKIQLENNEMISLISSNTKDHDICKKAFGYYLSWHHIFFLTEIMGILYRLIILSKWFRRRLLCMKKNDLATYFYCF